MRVALVFVTTLLLMPVACAQPYDAGPPSGDFVYRRHEGELRHRVEYAREQQHEAWLREHCVRDWHGEVVCRR